MRASRELDKKSSWTRQFPWRRCKRSNGQTDEEEGHDEKDLAILKSLNKHDTAKPKRQ